MFKRFRVVVRSPDGAGSGGGEGAAIQPPAPPAAPSSSPGQSAPESGTGMPDAGEGATPAGPGQNAQKQDGQSQNDPSSADSLADGYQPFALPDGMPADQAMLDRFSPIARDMGLSQTQAQAMVSLYAEQVQAQAKAQAEEQAKVWEETQAEWQTAARADPEFGGARFEENLGLARQALDRFGSPDLTEALNITGAGNHPAVLKFFAAVARATGDHRIVMPGTTGSSGEAMSTADFYAREVFGR